MNDDLLRSMDARLKRLEGIIAAQAARAAPKRHRDPKFRHILRQSMQDKGLSASDLAAKMFGRCVSSEGKNVARKRDRISRWLAGKDYPCDEHMALLAQFVDVV